MISLRDQLVNVALLWQERYGVAPHVTGAISEYDAARLIGCPEENYCDQMRGRTAVGQGFDFVFQQKRYQIKANRPSGKPGSFVTLVAKPRNYDWDYLIWIRYSTRYTIEEAWLWEVNEYRARFEAQKRLSPSDMRLGKRVV